LGANSILAISIVISKAAAGSYNISLAEYLNTLLENRTMSIPFPFFNVINGGQHAGNNLAIQEFMIVPVGVTSFEEAMYIGTKFYQTLKEVIKTKYGLSSISVGDEGGFAPKIDKAEEALDTIVEIIDSLNLRNRVSIALDIAASEFYEDGKYNLSYKWKNKKELCLSSTEYTNYLLDLINKYPSKYCHLIIVISIEDPFDQDDLESWSYFKSRTNIQVVGDDLTVTNINRIKLAHEKNCCNTLLLKINQIGTLSESIEAY
jgi:enolase